MGTWDHGTIGPHDHGTVKPNLTYTGAGIINFKVPEFLKIKKISEN